MIQGFLNNTNPDLDSNDHQRLVVDYLVLQAMKIFDIRPDDFYTGQSPDDKEARMACIHLLKQTTRYTYKRIGTYFNTNERSMLYFKQKCDEQLEIPQYYPEFTKRYEALEQQLIAFISKME